MVSLTRPRQTGSTSVRNDDANLVCVPGIATQLASDAQSPGVQEVKSISFRHQRHPIASGRR
jgi:hypothetical protein